MSETCHIVLSGIGRIIIAVGPTALWVGLFLFTILYFQHPIRAFLKRATGIEAFGAKILAESIEGVEGRSMLEGTVGQFMQNDMAVPYTYNLPATPNPHNVYFFSHDLMLTYAGLLTGARNETISWTLRSALNHVAPLGLTDSPVHKSLLAVNDKLQKASGPISEQDRQGMAQKVWIVSRFVGDVLFAPRTAPRG